MATRLALRTRVAAYIDDVDAARWSTSEIDDALTAAQQQAWLVAYTATPDLYQQEASVATTSGSANLSTLAIQDIVSVSINNGGTQSVRIPVPRVSAAAVQAIHSTSETLIINYIPRLTYPATTGDSFLWPSAANALLDDLMVLIAANALLSTKDGVQNAALIARMEELKAQIKAQAPSVTIIPIRLLKGAVNNGVKYYLKGGSSLLQLCI